MGEKVYIPEISRLTFLVLQTFAKHRLSKVNPKDLSLFL